MKRALVLLLLASVAHADSLYHDSNLVFQAKEKYEPVTIVWHVTDTVKDACNTLYFGKKPYNSHIEACAVRTGNQCDIYTQRKLDLAVLGHEVRHCYEGAWHDE